MAIKDEVEDLEKAGITVIQIDEAALREGLPLRKSEQTFYLNWAVHSFRITNTGVQDTTQVHLLFPLLFYSVRFGCGSTCVSMYKRTHAHPLFYMYVYRLEIVYIYNSMGACIEKNVYDIEHLFILDRSTPTCAIQISMTLSTP